MQPTGLLSRLEWRVRHAVTTTVSGDYRSVFRGRGMEFDQVVKFEWGDDPRDIDWNVTARLGEPYRKRFVEERDLSVMLVFEDSPALQFGSEGRTRRETLLEAAALYADRHQTRIVSACCTCPPGHLVRARAPGRRDIIRVVSVVVAAGAGARWADAMSDSLELGRNVAARGSVLPWLGPFLPALCRQAGGTCSGVIRRRRAGRRSLGRRIARGYAFRCVRSLVRPGDYYRHIRPATSGAQSLAR